MTNHRAPARWSQTALRERLLDWNGRMTEEAIRADERERIARFLSRTAQERDPAGPPPQIQELIGTVLEGVANLIRAGLDPDVAARGSDG